MAEGRSRYSMRNSRRPWKAANAGRGARCVDWARRAQIADGVNGPRADASESIRRAECAAPCLSPHVRCLAGELAFCVAAQGHAARRRLSERYNQRDQDLT